jgi:6-phosphofructokinase 1
MTELFKSTPQFNNVHGIQSVAVMTSGGDAPGMNAAIRAVVRTAITQGLTVYGIYDGFSGLYRHSAEKPKIKQLTAHDVGDVIHKGGTLLGSSRLPAFATDKKVYERCYENLYQMHIEALVVIGGDGSFRGINKLANEYSDYVKREHPEASAREMRVAGLPGTIDNDMGYTDYTIGFDTALNTSVQLINNVRDTMGSHHRVAVVEVMGRYCGDIAVNSGIAAGAEVILVPELNASEEEWMAIIQDKLERARARDKKYGIIVMSEGMHLQSEEWAYFTAEYLSGRINELIPLSDAEQPYESRSLVLAHVQRGGSPTAFDRMLASRLGYSAVDVLMSGANKRCLGIRHNEIINVSIEEAVNLRPVVDETFLAIANALA